MIYSFYDDSDDYQSGFPRSEGYSHEDYLADNEDDWIQQQKDDEVLEKYNSQK